MLIIEMNGKMVNSYILLRIQHISCEFVKFEMYMTLREETLSATNCNFFFHFG